MKTFHRFFISPSEIGERDVTLTNRDQVQQITRVLRMHEGDKLVLLDNTGMEYEVKIMSLSKKEVICRHVDKRESKGEPKVLIRLFQGLPKQLSKFEEVLRHGTELGVTEFYPLLTQNGENQELRKRERMEHILKESAEQSERGKIPILGPEIKFDEVLKNGWPPQLGAETTLLAYARESRATLSEVLQKMGTPTAINIIVGPEGGFTEEEVELAHKQAFIVFGLGARILRTETAGPAILSALLLGSFSAY